MLLRASTEGSQERDGRLCAWAVSEHGGSENRLV